MHNLKHQTDLELMTLIKDEKNPSAEYVLFRRYIPLISKMYHTYLHYGKNVIDFEDFENESFFTFLKAVDYFDFDKFICKTDWSFGYVFYLFLSKACRDINRVERKKKEVSLEVLDSNGNGLEVLSYTEDHSKNYDTLKFMSFLTQREQAIFHLRYLDKVEGFHTVSEIAKIMNCSKQWISLVLKEVTRKAHFYFNRNI